jgi:SAM-dependent methyltransferase
MPDPRLADDLTFDAVYPEAVRRVSARFWTPVDVARRAANLFAGVGARRVLDVGAGVGKFALVAAAVAPELQVLGVEQRPHLVEVARRARSRLNVANARFRVGDATTIPWNSFDGIYFFNPFEENLFAADERIDDLVILDESRFMRDVLRVDRELRRAPIGTAIVTYHGSGARLPACYELDRSEPAGSDHLRLWLKRREGGSLARCDLANRPW